MSRSTLLFNPAAASTEELEAVLVGRNALLDQLMDELAKQRKSKTVQHILLIGPRGSGKTHLTEILARRLAEGKHPWRSVRLPEESYSFAGLNDLIHGIAQRDSVEALGLSNASGEESDWDATAPSIDESIARIIANTEKTRTPLIAIIENLPRVLQRVLRGRKEISHLRAILMGDPPFTVLATATSYFEDITKEDRPLYDFFRVFTLQDLTADEVEELVTKRAKWDGIPAVLEEIDVLKRRVRAIHHLSGGNPRLALALYEVLTSGVSQDIHRQFMGLLDRVTPYYQARIEDLSAQQAQVLAKLAGAPESLTASKLAKIAGLSTSHITAVLDVLLAERFVRRVSTAGKTRSAYALTDRLFRIWLEMRESRGARKRLQFLIEFYRTAYTRKELLAAWSHWLSSFAKRIGEEWGPGCNDHALTIDYLAEALKISDYRKGQELVHLIRDGDSEANLRRLQDAAAAAAAEHPSIAAALHMAITQRYLFVEQPVEALKHIELAVRLVGENESTRRLGVIARFMNQDYPSVIATVERFRASRVAGQDMLLWAAVARILIGDKEGAQMLKEGIGQEECRNCNGLRLSNIVAALPSGEGWQGRVGLVLDAIGSIFGEHSAVLTAFSVRAIRAGDNSAAVAWGKKATALEPRDKEAWHRLACAYANCGDVEAFVEATAHCEPSSASVRRHLLRDVALALRSRTVSATDVDVLRPLFERLATTSEDITYLYRGLWQTLERHVAPAWVGRLVGAFELLGGEEREPWHSFREYVESGSAEEYLDKAHPEVREAVQLILSELEIPATVAKLIPAKAKLAVQAKQKR